MMIDMGWSNAVYSRMPAKTVGCIGGRSRPPPAIMLRKYGEDKI